MGLDKVRGTDTAGVLGSPRGGVGLVPDTCSGLLGPGVLVRSLAGQESGSVTSPGRPDAGRSQLNVWRFLMNLQVEHGACWFCEGDGVPLKVPSSESHPPRAKLAVPCSRL